MNAPLENSSALPCIKIVSGGQTGADRAGLDVAIARGLPHGGWCPKGRKAEDGPLPARYLLTETPTANYLVRTERNVAESDATVIFTPGALSGGSKRTADFAKIHGRPLLHLTLFGVSEIVAAGRLVAFVRAYRVKTLNVAGTRESKEPGIHEWVCRVLERAFDSLGISAPRSATSNPGNNESPTAESRWGLTVDDFCELHALRHRHWAAVAHDPEVPETARTFLMNCVPVLKTSGSVISDVLPSGVSLLNFLCQNGYTVQLSWYATSINVHLAMHDVELLTTSGVHTFESEDSGDLTLGEKFDELVISMLLALKYRRFD